MNVLFVMKHRGNAGNTHAVANYMRVAPRHGHAAAIYGDRQPHLPNLRFSTDIHAFDRVVYLFESELYRAKRLREATMLAAFPRTRRLIFDMDGMYNPVIRLDGYDFNHADEASRAEWIAFYDALADRVAKPTLAPPDDPGVAPMLFYGYDPALEADPAAAPAKRYDVLHVGHNWWRWREVAGELLPAFAEIRGEIGEIGFIGLWWDGPPAEGADAGPRPAFGSDPDEFRRLRIRTTDAVLYSDVVRTMSTARINIFTQRPILHHLKHITLKYFEIFYADTIPLLMLDGDLAEAVYGPAARELVLKGRVVERLLDALRRPEHYQDIVRDVRRHLAARYAYDLRIEELVTALRH